MKVLRSREAYEAEEAERLAPYAAKSAQSKGRVFAESPHAYRTAFQRDRDRVVHSLAFRRLEYKTQVFVYHEVDHLRNRLTHTLEAAQITRTIARALRLNEELAEAVVLAHDLGHTPFGHAGERVLADLMKGHGDFDHNRQSLRIVDLLEERYPSFRGLNLTSETREGILKHGAAWAHPLPLPELGAQPSLEAQVADLADEIAYTNHDLDDGLRSGLLSFEALAPLPLWGEAWRETRDRHKEASDRVVRAQTIVALIDRLVTDLLEATAERVAAAAPADVDTLRTLPERLAGFRPETAEALAELEAYLYEHFYLHPRVVERSDQAVHVIGDLFRWYREAPELLPGRVQGLFDVDGEERAIADYVAGMTDRFALNEHRRLGQARG
jgi:dGTPase